MHQSAKNKDEVIVNTDDGGCDPIWFFSDDEHNALVLSLMLQKRGLDTQWVTSQCVDNHMHQMQYSLIIYDISLGLSCELTNRNECYYEKLVALPSSAFLVGLGDAKNIPRHFHNLRSRTNTFLRKPFDVNDAISLCRLVRFNTNDIPV